MNPATTIGYDDFQTTTYVPSVVTANETPWSDARFASDGSASYRAETSMPGTLNDGDKSDVLGLRYWGSRGSLPSGKQIVSIDFKAIGSNNNAAIDCDLWIALGGSSEFLKIAFTSTSTSTKYLHATPADFGLTNTDAYNALTATSSSSGPRFYVQADTGGASYTSNSVYFNLNEIEMSVQYTDRTGHMLLGR